MVPRMDMLERSLVEGGVDGASCVCIPHSIVDTFDLLGAGSFSQVYRAKIHPSSLSKARGSSEVVDGSLDEDCTQKHLYAVKKLRPSIEAEKGAVYLMHAASDLAMEAKLLVNLPFHENIISLHAVSEDFFSDPASGFLVLDILKETLLDVFIRWRKEAKHVSQLVPLLRSKSQTQFEKAREVCRATQIALPVASAMAFLHRHRISYRDIKPSNIGFDDRGNVRIFDFGLARVYTDDRAMTPCSGSTRYMSPEVMVGGKYDLSADVYSYAILLWEVCTRSFQQPYALIKDAESAKRAIAGRRYRPPIHHIYNKTIQNVLIHGWHQNPQIRPSFSLIVTQLETLERPQDRQVAAQSDKSSTRETRRRLMFSTSRTPKAT